MTVSVQGNHIVYNPPQKAILCGNYVTEISDLYVNVFVRITIPWYYNAALRGTTMETKDLLMSVAREHVTHPELLGRDNILSWLYRRDLKDVATVTSRDF